MKVLLENKDFNKILWNIFLNVEIKKGKKYKLLLW